MAIITTKINPELPNILYVDDEISNLTCFKAAFRKDFNIFTASSGREGLEILRTYPIQVIVTDQRMPEMTGTQFLEAVIPEYPNAIRMILTGYSDVESTIQSINNGMVFRYITKPWDPKELKMILDTAVKMYELEKSNRRLVAKLQEELEEKQRMIASLKKHVPGNIINEVAHSENVPSPLSLVETRVVSILFSQIIGFNEIINNVDPQTIVDYINNYIRVMVECIEENKGSFNKFINDGVVALFGAPLSYICNQCNAIACGMAILKELENFNRQYSSLIGKNIDICIGINTGKVIAGSMGSPEQVEYTVIGDGVVTAARIAELSQNAPNTLLISESTYLPVKDNVEVEEVNLRFYNGAKEEIKLYKVKGFSLKLVHTV